MGNSYFSTNYESWTHPEIAPDRNKQSKHDPTVGFEGRKERVSPLTEEQMRLARIPADKRDYCGAYLVELNKCRRENFPFVGSRCDHERHEYHHCQADDVLLRMKEYERERRLLKRDERRRAKGIEVPIN